MDNDFDPEGDGQTVTSAADSDGNVITVGTSFTLPSGGTIVIEEDGAYTYDPLPGFVGTEVIPYTITDDNVDGVATDMATLYLTTFLGNNATVAQNDVNQTPINVPVSGNILTNDSDAQGDGQTVSELIFDTDGDGEVNDTVTKGTTVEVFGTDLTGAVVPGGTIVLGADGAYTYTPSLDFEGDVPGAYTVLDDNGDPATDDATITITVIGGDEAGVPQPPVAIDDINSTEVNVPVTANVILPNDSDPEDQDLMVTGILGDLDGSGLNDDTIVVGAPTPIFGTADDGMTVPAGSITLSEDGTYTYVPAADFTGNVDVNYTITDEDDLSDDAVLSISSVPDSGNITFANDDSNSGPSGEEQVGNLVDNDFDPEGDGQTVTSAADSDGNVITVGTSFTLPSGGTIVIEEDGAYTYDPLPGFVGTEVIPYTITDDNADGVATDMATLYLTTLPENDGTVAIDDINQAAVNTPVDGDLGTNDFDLDGDDIFIDTILVALDADGILDDVVPVGSTNTVYGVDLEGNVVVAGAITVNGASPPGITGTTTAGRSAVSALVMPTASFPYSFVPVQDFLGRVQLAYSIVDDNPSMSRDDALLTITVLDGEILCEPGPPTAVNDIFLAESGVTLTENVILLDDYDADVPTLVITQLVIDRDSDGTVNDTIDPGMQVTISGVTESGAIVEAGIFSIATDGLMAFTPGEEFTGDVSAVYTIMNVNGFTDDGTISITVLEDQDNKSFANDDVAIGQVGTSLFGNVLENDSDPQGEEQTVESASDAEGTLISLGVRSALPGGGSILLEEDGAYEYIPANGFIGTDAVIYTVTDGMPAPFEFSATLHLTSIPSIGDTIPEVTPQDVPVTTCIELCDAPGDVENILSCGDPANGTITSIDTTTGCVEYTPNDGFTGVDEYCVIVEYGGGITDTTRVIVTVGNDSASVACIARINVTLDDSCSFNVIAEQVLTGLLPNNPNDVLDIVVQDGDTTNGSIIDGCGEYVYVVDLGARKAWPLMASEAVGVPFWPRIKRLRYSSVLPPGSTTCSAWTWMPTT